MTDPAPCTLTPEYDPGAGEEESEGVGQSLSPPIDSPEKLGSNDAPVCGGNISFISCPVLRVRMPDTKFRDCEGP